MYPKTTPLVKQVIYKDDNLDKVAAVQWGRSNEEYALKQFYAHEAGKHIDFKLLPAGLFLDRHPAYIGASPDAIMHCKCHGQSIVEINLRTPRLNATLAHNCFAHRGALTWNKLRTEIKYAKSYDSFKNRLKKQQQLSHDVNLA